MDWMQFDQQLPQSQTLDTPRVTPSSPSSSATEGPGFSLRRFRNGRSSLQATSALPLLPPALRFPEPATLWTA